mmetsp:Transcript_47281/g.137642  ORF Transcript_47281/g.137642 Transcript_47281/m.137642 type:complete len:202 (-) Transcript_47281:278-883(-)
MEKLGQEQQRGAHEVELPALLAALTLGHRGHAQRQRDQQQRGPLRGVELATEDDHGHDREEDRLGALEDDKHRGGRPVKEAQRRRRPAKHLEEREGDEVHPRHDPSAPRDAVVVVARLVFPGLRWRLFARIAWLLRVLLAGAQAGSHQHHLEHEHDEGQRQRVGELVSVAVVPTADGVHVEHGRLRHRGGGPKNDDDEHDH